MSEVVLLGVLAAVAAAVIFLALSQSRGAWVSRHGRPGARWARALLPLAVLAVVAAPLASWLDSSRVLWGALGLGLATFAWLPATRRWSAPAHTSWALSTLAGLLYLVSMAVWTTGSGLIGMAYAASWALWLLELAAFVLLLSYGWEIHDALGSQVWNRRLAPGAAALAPGERAPFVSVHVPSHNEPPDMVIETLQALLRLDYPAYEVLVIDNNTDDDALCAPVEEFCRANPDRLSFHRLRDWPGFKSGALNYAEAHTDTRAEVIAVVDADYQVEPDWLRESVGAFADPRVGFVQSPQDYRDWQDSAYLRSLYFSYDYFFRVSQPSRDERDAAIFGGTMGLVRREALLDVGGWDEWCVTEDAELSLRLLGRGWTGHHLDRAYGHGIMPLTFEALKRQRFRWCFGGMQILKRHWRDLMPWSRRTQLGPGQRLGYLVGGIQWFGDLVGLLFSVVVVASLVDLAFGDGFVVRRLSGLLLIAVPALVLLGLVRAVAVLRAVGPSATWRDALGAFFVWSSLGWVVAMACVRGLVEPRGVFLRTPKVRGEGRWSDAARANVVELGFAVVAVAATLAAAVQRPGWAVAGLGALLAVPVAGWVTAPLHSLAALRVDLSPQLRRRRAGEWARGWWRAPGARVSVASMFAVFAGVAIVFGLVQPTSDQTPRGTVLPNRPQTTHDAPVTPLPTTGVPTRGGSSSTTAGTASVTTPGGSVSTPAGAVTTPVPAATTSLPTQANATAVPPPTSRPAGSPTARPTPTNRPTTVGSPTTTRRP